MSKKLDIVLEKQEGLEKHVGVLLEIQESHFEDVEDLGEVVEGGKGLLNTLESTSNAFVEDTEKIVTASNAAMAAGYRALEILAMLGSVSLAGFLVFLAFQRPKTQETPSNLLEKEPAPSNTSDPPKHKKSGIRPME